ncbi:diacylglycerol/lipid kinase family protein [Singulisphaera acidiphila]|uniref:Sphingosine/diacylglycerol kinase-like enzyme n=1 Tax=Singulisphaera acidiphila (strain ATCC BAA-1392 / DSM 18658 / VKM B-2454 / MOB10) TaxID=886293 RepID=L0DPU0_SINAD|nr:diacylglycerol kinase family protein [Singulisphaera acidiphila]AGA31272.1 sphingosine/diacylglycerol kinase-like enzyme [Singulisphaera acidiphila DSM 18658]
MTEGVEPGLAIGHEARSGAIRSNGEGVGSDQPWVGIAANPGSGRGRGRRQVERLQAELERLGLSTRVAWSLPDRAVLVAESAADPHCRCLVAAGGDGTVAALVNERPAVPITVLPAGTENLFARHFRLDRNPARLASIIAAGAVAQLDLGLTATRRFTLMAGIGFDADVVARHHSTRVGRAGVARPTHRGAYVESVLRSSLEYRFPRLTVSITDPGAEETLVGATAFIFNLPRYALGLPFAPTARGDDGWLDLVVFRNAGPLQSLRYLWMVLRGIHLDRDGVEHRRFRRVVVTSAETVPVQLDGDPGGSVSPEGHPDGVWSVEVLPNALEVLVPDGG